MLDLCRSLVLFVLLLNRLGNALALYSDKFLANWQLILVLLAYLSDIKVRSGSTIFDTSFALHFELVRIRRSFTIALTKLFRRLGVCCIFSCVSAVLIFFKPGIPPAVSNIKFVPLITLWLLLLLY